MTAAARQLHNALAGPACLVLRFSTQPHTASDVAALDHFGGSLFASLETFEHIKVTKREWEDDEEAVHKRSF